MGEELAASYRKPIYFNQEEKDNILEAFLENIKKDDRITKQLKKGESKRFSTAIKFLMNLYNNQSKKSPSPPRVKEEVKNVPTN